ncbi:hypothetical protein KK083_09045 [Fulvivirgaceae bacterium PWU4]|uniref:Uncharacterized protein n=1 Tax=Chryseosolibacter histidini TaxID=2782349 RepID=A0AAP2DKI6_9BACT|nr:hypothetical protein [Chryseosolibacter histidini]MBT1697018.1 hypothetical protein [Chryseosolibacter histidini]
MLLSKLTPAETLLIRDGSQAPVRELLKFTFMDLLLKQVLRAEDVERQLNLRDPVRTYKYVSRGENFPEHNILAHELTFLLPYRKNEDTRMLFRNCIQVGYENARSKRALHKTIRLSPELQNAFTASLIQKVFGEYEHTAHGLLLKQQVESEIRQLERELPPLIATDREKAMEKLKIIGGNVFLLQGLNFAVLKVIDEAFAETFIPESTSSCGGSWTTFNTYSDDFDSASDSNGNGCSSGDSSGCGSGDSGCGGGCGGCGGD